MNQSITKKITTITAFLMLMFSVKTFGQIQPDIPTDAPPVFEKTISDVVNGPYEKTIEFTQNEDEFTVFEIAGYGVNTYEILNGNINLKDLQPYPSFRGYPTKNYLLLSNQCSACIITYGSIEKTSEKSLIEVQIKTYKKLSNPQRLRAELIQQKSSQTINIKNKLPLFEDEIHLREELGEVIKSTHIKNTFLYEKALQEHISIEVIESLLDSKINYDHPERVYLDANKHLILGHIQLSRGNYKNAIQQLEKSIELLKLTKPTSKESILYGIHLAKAYTSLSEAHLELNPDLESTKTLINTAIELSKKFYQYSLLEISYNNLGFLERKKHNLDLAIEYHKKALNISSSSEFTASAYEQELLTSLMRSNYYLAVVSAIKGRYYESINLINNSEEIVSKLDIPNWTAHIKAAKARIFLELKQYDKSLPEYESAWTIYEEMNDTEQLGVLSFNLGRLYSELGNSELAFQYIDKSYELFSEPKDIEYKIKTTSTLANALLTNKEFTKASELFDELITLSENSTDLFLKGRSLTNKAEALINLEENYDAINYLENAIELQKTRKDDLYETKSNYLIALALSKTDKNNHQLIKAYLSSAKETIEKIRSSLQDDSLRQQYFSLQKSIYELEIRLYMERPEADPINAIISAENFRARTLYESITKKNNTIINQEDNKPISDHLISTNDRFLQLEDAISLLSNDINKPKNPTKLKNLQNLDNDTAILYYFIGSEKSYSWLITNEKIYSSELQDSLHVALVVDAYINRINNQPTGNLNSNLWKDLYYKTESISDLLLSAHIEHIKNYKNLIISPDGPLHKIPFAALNTNLNNKKIEYLSKNHTISYIPSILTYKHIASEKTLTSENSLLLISNPELKIRTQPGNEKNMSLPSAYQEAKTIVNLWEKLGKVTWLDGKYATKKNLQLSLSHHYQILHFATHALANWDYPGQSSIALSNSEFEDMEQANLTLEDISDLKIRPDLVILSACDTAVGKQIEGEGPIGLSRAFLEAGSNKVIASLWPVNDEASAELMSYFYKSLLLDNKSATEALTIAQEKIRNHAQWSHPYYWSGFNLYGNNK